MKKLVIEPGCISCGACEFYAPEVFEVTDICHVKNGVSVHLYYQQIEKAIKGCPVRVIAWRGNEKS